MKDRIIIAENIKTPDIYNLNQKGSAITLEEIYENNKIKLKEFRSILEKNDKANKQVKIKFRDRSENGTKFFKNDEIYPFKKFDLAFIVRPKNIPKSRNDTEKHNGSSKAINTETKSIKPSSISSFLKNYKYINESDFESTILFIESYTILSIYEKPFNDLGTLFDNNFNAELFEELYFNSSQNLWEILNPYINNKIFSELENGSEKELLNTILFKDDSYLRIKNVLDVILKNYEGISFLEYIENRNTKLYRELVFIEILIESIFNVYKESEIDLELPASIFTSLYFYIPSIFVNHDLINKVLSIYNLGFGQVEQFKRNYVVTRVNGEIKKDKSFSYKPINVYDFANDKYLGDLISLFLPEYSR
jgi:hypothetical protein